MQGNYETALRWTDVYAQARQRREARQRNEAGEADKAPSTAAPSTAAPSTAAPTIVRSVGALHCGAVLYLWTDGTIRLGNGNEIKTALR